MTPPTTFISYSHDSDDHKAWVLRLAHDLVANGVQTTIDQWDLAPGEDIAAFAMRGVSSSDRVILICTEKYVEKSDSGTGGVGFERQIVTAELVQSVDTKKFIPLIRDNPDHSVPTFMAGRRYIDFNDDGDYAASLDELLRELHGEPPSTRPPLGPNPFTGTPPGEGAQLRLAGPTGLRDTGEPILDDPWFLNHETRALRGLGTVELEGAMEVRFALHDPVVKSQLELLNAVSDSQIHTFGWPIGITLENRDEYRARPVEDGIVAEVAIRERNVSGEPSYDYWSARNNGDFYLLQSLFEDQRRPGHVFFDTRIVRMTEALLFAGNFYRHLDVPDAVRVSILLSHRGLAGRVLTAASPDRIIRQTTSVENVSTSRFTATLRGLSDNLTDHVMRALAPTFMLFDFTEFERRVYDEIVQNFRAGRVG